MTTSSWLPSSAGESFAVACREPRRWAIDFCRTAIFLCLFSLMLAPEFARDAASDSGLALYAKAMGGFRFVDLAIAALVLCHVVVLGCTRTDGVSFPRRLALPGLAFLACVAVAILYGSARGGSNFFFDWRGLALGIGLYVVWYLWLQAPCNLESAIRLFAIYMAARIGLLYILFLTGNRDSLLGVSIPLFDGPALSCIVFAALLAVRYQETARAPLAKLLWRGLTASAYLIVLLCFRRTYWGELAVGTVLLLALRKRHRIRNLIFLLATICIAGAILGNPFSSRIASLDVTDTDSEFAADNADHVLDLVDAWDQVRQSPVMGIGLGTSYSTWHIRRWKPESVMVHNAPLHVWLKYGLAGLLAYLWFHLALLRWMYRRSRDPASSYEPFFSATFAYLTAQFVMTLGFAPWPYSELQLTALMSFLVTVAVVAHRQDLALRS